MDPLKYRGLALQSCILKIYSGILNDRIVRYADQTGLLVEEQNGFRKKRSCQQHIFSILTLARNLLEKSRLKRNRTGIDHGLYTCFVNFKKAFDVTDRDLLFYQLAQCGIKGPILDAIRSMYKNTVNTIRINECFSGEFSSTKGVLQGNNKSPTLFNVYLNSLLRELKSCEAGVAVDESVKISFLAYADDIVLLSDTEAGLQKLINVVNNWCLRWRMKVNVNKTKIMHIRRKNSKCTEQEFKLGTKRIEIVTCYKYLGVIIDEYVTMGMCEESLAKAASRALGMVICKTKEGFELSYDSYSKMYDSMVLPILDYAYGAWGTGGNLTKMDSVHHRAIRFFCGLPKKTPVLGLIGDMGWIPGVVRQDLDTLRFFNHLMSLPHDRLAYKMVNFDALGTEGCWSKNIKHLLMSLDMLDKWEGKQPVCLK